MCPFLFPEAATKAFPPGSHLRVFPWLESPNWQLPDSCLPPAHDTQFALGPCIDPGHATSLQQTCPLMTSSGCVQGRISLSTVGSSVSTPGPVYLSAVNNVLKLEKAEPPAFWSASEDGSTWEPSSGRLWNGSSGSCCQTSKVTKVEKNISVQNG